MGQAATNIDFARGLYLGPKVAVVHQNIDLFFSFIVDPHPKTFELACGTVCSSVLWSVTLSLDSVDFLLAFKSIKIMQLSV